MAGWSGGGAWKQLAMGPAPEFAAPYGAVRLAIVYRQTPGAAPLAGAVRIRDVRLEAAR